MIGKFISDDLDQRLAGYVLANRINDMTARPDSKRFQRYLSLVRDQWRDEPVTDPLDEYREKARLMTPNALDRYEREHGVTLVRDRLFFYEDPDVKVAALPDAIEPPWIGITVHCRRSLRTWQKAEKDGITNAMERHAQAMMLVTGRKHWIHLNYFESPDQTRFELSDHLSNHDRRHAADLEESMLSFLLKTRRKDLNQ